VYSNFQWLALLLNYQFFENVSEAVTARQRQMKKRSLRTVNEYFESVFNVAVTTQVVFSDTDDESPIPIQRNE
jgi:hypothetical protein